MGGANCHRQRLPEYRTLAAVEVLFNLLARALRLKLGIRFYERIPYTCLAVWPRRWRPRGKLAFRRRNSQIRPKTALQSDLDASEVVSQSVLRDRDAETTGEVRNA